jgi:hypothetical protein
LPIDTVDAPVFHSVATTVAVESVPTTVLGKVPLFQVIVNVDGVTVFGLPLVVDVGDVFVAQLAVNSDTRRKVRCARRTGGVHCIAKAAETL